MPRDSGTGIYSTPTGTDGIPNRTISSTAYNLNVHDVETDLNTPRPIIAGGTGASDAATAVKNLGAMPKGGVGQCYLAKSGANLVLLPKDGVLLMINSAVETIPDAGLTLVPTGNAASTLYYIYAYMNSGVMTLEYSTTPYTGQAGTGVRTKTGDVTRTLVGIWASTGAASWSAIATEGASYFNPKQKSSESGFITPGTTSFTIVEMSVIGRVPFVSFPDRLVSFDLMGHLNSTPGPSGNYFNVGLDAVLNQLASSIYIYSYASVDSRGFYLSRQALYTEARHYLTGTFSTNSGTLSCSTNLIVSTFG